MSKKYKDIGICSDSPQNYFNEIKNYKNFTKELDKVFTENKDISPRQLYYILVQEVNDKHLDALLGL